MNMLYYCLLLGYFTLGIPTIRSYPLSHGVFHVIFMHRQPPQIFHSYMPHYNNSEQNFGNSLYSRDNNNEPNFENSLYSSDHNLRNPLPFPPMRKFYHDMMSYLDRSMGSIADMDQEYNKPRKVEDPWVQFITRTKTELNETNGKANTTIFETNTTHTKEKDSNTTVLGNHTKEIINLVKDSYVNDTSDKNMGFNSTTNVTKNSNMAKPNNNDKVNDNVTIAAKLNDSKHFDGLSENSTMNDTTGDNIPFSFPVLKKTIQLMRRVRRHSKESKLDQVKHVPTVIIETLNGSTTKPLTMLLGNQSETVWNINQTRDTLQTDDNQTKEIVSFTSTVEKMIDLIDKQLENKTQALLKRMKRVMDIKDDLLKESYVKYNVGKNNTDLFKTIDNTFTNDNNTVNVPNKTIDTTEHETKTIDITTLETMATVANITSAEPLANTTAHTPATITILPASNDNNQTNITSLPILLEAHTTVQTDSKPDLSTGLSVENSTNEKQQHEEPTKPHTNCPFSVLSTIRVSGISTDELTSETNSPSRTLAKTKEIQDDDDDDDENNGQKLRNILDSIPDDTNIIDRTSGQAQDDDPVTSGDLMTALVIPVFLVVLMGSILYAMHNMSQYVINYIGETNVDRTNQDNNHELRTLIVTNPEPTSPNPEPTSPANQINKSPSNQDNNEERTSSYLVVNNLEPNIVNNPEPNGNTGDMLPQTSPTPANRTTTTEKTP